MNFITDNGRSALCAVRPHWLLPSPSASGATHVALITLRSAAPSKRRGLSQPSTSTSNTKDALSPVLCTSVRTDWAVPSPAPSPMHVRLPGLFTGARIADVSARPLHVAVVTVVQGSPVLTMVRVDADALRIVSIAALPFGARASTVRVQDGLHVLALCAANETFAYMPAWRREGVVRRDFTDATIVQLFNNENDNNNEEGDSSAVIARTEGSHTFFLLTFKADKASLECFSRLGAYSREFPSVTVKQARKCVAAAVCLHYDMLFFVDDELLLSVVHIPTDKVVSSNRIQLPFKSAGMPSLQLSVHEQTVFLHASDAQLKCNDLQILYAYPVHSSVAGFMGFKSMFSPCSRETCRSSDPNLHLYVVRDGQVVKIASKGGNMTRADVCVCETKQLKKKGLFNIGTVTGEEEEEVEGGTERNGFIDITESKRETSNVTVTDGQMKSTTSRDVMNNLRQRINNGLDNILEMKQMNLFKFNMLMHLSNYMCDVAQHNSNKPSRSSHHFEIPKELSIEITAPGKPAQVSDSTTPTTQRTGNEVSHFSTRGVSQINQHDLLVKPLCIDVRVDDDRKFVLINCLVKVLPEDNDMSDTSKIRNIACYLTVYISNVTAYHVKTCRVHDFNYDTPVHLYASIPISHFLATTGETPAMDVFVAMSNGYQQFVGKFTVYDVVLQHQQLRHDVGTGTAWIDQLPIRNMFESTSYLMLRGARAHSFDTSALRNVTMRRKGTVGSIPTSVLSISATSSTDLCFAVLTICNDLARSGTVASPIADNGLETVQRAIELVDMFKAEREVIRNAVDSPNSTGLSADDILRALRAAYTSLIARGIMQETE